MFKTIIKFFFVNSFAIINAFTNVMIEINNNILKRKNLLKLNTSFKKFKIKSSEYLIMSFNDDDTSIENKKKIKKI